RRNLDLSGSQLSNQSSGSTVLSAGQDLTLASGLQQTVLDRMAGLYLGQGTGPMLLAAGATSTSAAAS
ncbi:hypothetical protein, partial [Aquitalea pelogenes]|uniref:hypothetical protein n=1 Tax=Aquitalea pelogenes TaxID=1293573 RepID=UPI00137B227F